MNAPAPAVQASEAIARLDALAAELADRGWTARIQAPVRRRPSLYVRNPEPGAIALSEHIYAHPLADGTWMFWWPWADRIAGTAAVIVRVLRPAQTPRADDRQRTSE